MTPRSNDAIFENRDEAEDANDDPTLAHAILQTVAGLIGWTANPTELREALRRAFGRRGTAARMARARAWLDQETRRIERLAGAEPVVTESGRIRERRVIIDTIDAGPKILRFTPSPNARGRTARRRNAKKIRPA